MGKKKENEQEIWVRGVMKKGHFLLAGIELPACKAAFDTSATQEPTASNEAEQCHNGVGPQEGLEETGCTGGGGIL